MTLAEQRAVGAIGNERLNVVFLAGFDAILRMSMQSSRRKKLKGGLTDETEIQLYSF
jgi:hypothetical protein